MKRKSASNDKSSAANTRELCVSLVKSVRLTHEVAEFLSLAVADGDMQAFLEITGLDSDGKMEIHPDPGHPWEPAAVDSPLPKQGTQ